MTEITVFFPKEKNTCRKVLKVMYVFQPFKCKSSTLESASNLTYGNSNRWKWTKEYHIIKTLHEDKIWQFFNLGESDSVKLKTTGIH